MFLLFNKNCIISQGPVFRKMQLFHLQWRTLVIFLQAFPLLSCWTVALPISQKANQSTSWKLHLALSTSPYLVAQNCAQMIFDHEWNERETFSWEKVSLLKWRQLKNRRMNGFTIYHRPAYFFTFESNSVFENLQGFAAAISYLETFLSEVIFQLFQKIVNWNYHFYKEEVPLTWVVRLHYGETRESRTGVRKALLLLLLLRQ